MRIGITGHQDIQADVVPHIEEALKELISGRGRDFSGVSSLAAGADQLFASIVLDQGGSLHVIVPCEGYETTFAEKRDLDRFKTLISHDVEVETLDYAEPSEEAYLSAGRAVVDNSDVLIAVWDGNPAAGKGGTGDIVAYARTRGVDVKVVWPLELVRQ
jgi:hypothetical protein